MFLLLLLSISLPLQIDAGVSNELPMEPFDQLGNYVKVESFANDLHFEPGQKCPCGEYKLNEMKLVYFQWNNPNVIEKYEIEMARYLISKTYIHDGKLSRIHHATLISYPENKPHKCVAIKMVNDKEGIIDDDLIRKEREVLESLKNTKHIIGCGPYHSYSNYNEELDPALIMEIGQDFNAYLSQLDDTKYSEEMMLKILKQILIGIAEIHLKNFVHLDLKTANIVKMPGNVIHLKIIDFGSAIKLENGEAKKIKKYLITNPHFLQIQLKLADFGSANKLEYGKKKKITKTPQFLAPEIEMANNEDEVLITEKADIWSFGIIIIDLLSNTPTFKKEFQENFQNGKEKEDKLKYEIIPKYLNNKDIEEIKPEMQKSLDKFLPKLEESNPKVFALLKVN